MPRSGPALARASAPRDRPAAHVAVARATVLTRLRATVRGRLLALLLVATLPVLLLTALGAVASWHATLQAAALRLAQDRDVAVALNEARLAGAQAMLRLLAQGGRGRPDCAEVVTAAVSAGLRLALHDGPDGSVSCATAQLPGEPPEAWRAALGGGDPPPLLRPAEGRASVLVAEGVALAEVALQAPRPTVALALAGATRRDGAPPLPAGLGPERVEDGAGVAWLSTAGALGPGLTLVVGEPAAPIRAAALRAALRQLAEVTAVLALGAMAVFLGTSYAVTRPLGRLRDAVRRWRDGAPPTVPAAEGLPEELRDLAEAFRDGAAALATREAELRAATGRAELLAAEVHHRVKNNLQIVSSLLALQAGRVADPAARAEFEAARDRVAALATLHRHLYVHHDPEAVDLGAFIGEIGAHLFAAIGERPGRRVAMEVAAPPLRIASDQAVPLALVITESVSAALNQGFPGGRRGRIAIRLEAGERKARLSVEDDGIWPRAEDTLRATLLRGLARQLGGELRGGPGLLALDFPLRPPLPRDALPSVPTSVAGAGPSPRGAAAASGGRDLGR